MLVEVLELRECRSRPGMGQKARPRGAGDEGRRRRVEGTHTARVRAVRSASSTSDKQWRAPGRSARLQLWRNDGASSQLALEVWEGAQEVAQLGEGERGALALDRCEGGVSLGDEPACLTIRHERVFKKKRGEIKAHSSERSGFVTQRRSILLPMAVWHLSKTLTRLPASLKSVELRSSSRLATVLPLSVMAAREANGANDEA